MFSVETKKYGEVRVSFMHYNPAKSIIPNAGTLCIIDTNGENEERISYGRTKLAPCDQYCKERGRKLSLARALKRVGFSRDERIKFWRGYFAAQGREELIND